MLVDLATLEAARSSTRGGGWAPSSLASPSGSTTPPRAARRALKRRGSRLGHWEGGFCPCWAAAATKDSARVSTAKAAWKCARASAYAPRVLLRSPRRINSSCLAVASMDFSRLAVASARRSDSVSAAARAATPSNSAAKERADASASAHSRAASAADASDLAET